ncbi:MFS transporter permease [Azospirillum brasilense]|nr:MFS transporter permease [Azospirillum brasilense]
MPEWWTYSAEDFLLFSPRTYWRLIERHNETLWPAHIPMLLLGAAILLWLIRPRPWSHRLIPGTLAILWAWLAWSFLWERYATINWAAPYVAPFFALQAALLAVIGGRLRWSLSWAGRAPIGFALFLYALVLHPLAALLAGRSLRGAEVFGITPDPTAIATIGLVMMADGRWSWSLLAVPTAWCVASWATLHSMEASEQWVLLAAALIALVPVARRRPARPAPTEHP